jgi:hypothetical protein
VDEPIAYINVEERKLEWATPIKWETPTVVKMDKVPLFTVPPKKEWVALTDDEVDDIGCDFATLGGDIEGKNWFAFYLAIEAKLKEKNNG